MSRSYTKNKRQDLFAIETTVADGLEELSLKEIHERLGGRAKHVRIVTRGILHFQLDGDLGQLSTLCLAESTFVMESFVIPRPKGLLGDQNWRRLLALVSSVVRTGQNFESVELSAAGAESAVMQRILTQVSRETGLNQAASKGDLLIRIRPSLGKNAWDVLVRTSPRPSATRSWRVCNLEGALNGPVAYAMHEITAPKPSDAVLNLGAGSGTLLIERARHTQADVLIGIDNDLAAMSCCQKNIFEAGIHGVDLIAGDMRALPFRSGFADVICADLPFGQLVGSHSENLRLYPALLRESARVAKPEGRLIVLTHEMRLFEAALLESPWKAVQKLQISQRGVHPAIYLARLRKSS